MSAKSTLGKGMQMQSLNALDSPLGSGHTGSPFTYTNFPTILIAGHALMLRRNWPEDFSEEKRENAIPLLNHFGTTGELLELSDASGQAIAAQWIKVHRNDPLPESGSSAWPGALSSLRTAMRYSRLGWLEVGPLHTAISGRPTRPVSHFIAALMWQGIQRLMDRNGLGFALGLSVVPPPDVDSPITDMIPLLLERHGLDPEFGYQPRKFAASKSPWITLQTYTEACLPNDLRESLRRGAKLCGEPHHDPQGNHWFFWAYAE
jgi:hypothetical protein